MSAIVTNLDNVYELQLVLPTRTITKYFDWEVELENELAKLPVESISYETMTCCGCSEQRKKPIDLLTRLVNLMD